MPETTYQKITKPGTLEQLLEIFVGLRLEELGAIFGNAYIEGLRVEWVSTSSIRVGTGMADLPNGDRRLRVSNPITVSGIALGNNKWGHAYLYNNGGVPAVEVISQDTVSPTNYFGAAYQKGADASRRYLFSVRTNSSGNILKFTHHLAGNRVRYVEPLAGNPCRILTAGTATAETTVPCNTVIPVTSRLGDFRVTNTATNAAGGITLGNSEDNVTLPTSWLNTCAPQDDAQPELPVDSLQAITYAYAAAPVAGAAYIDVAGYWFDR